MYTNITCVVYILDIVNISKTPENVRDLCAFLCRLISHKALAEDGLLLNK